MTTRTLSRPNEKMLSSFDDFFKPWNEWFEEGMLDRVLKVPAVNITLHNNEYLVALAAPGLKKEDFKIEIEGNMLKISNEQEQKKEEKDKTYTRMEYSYSAFSRSFTLPDEIISDKIVAKYEDGILNITLPRRMDSKSTLSKKITVK